MPTRFVYRRKLLTYCSSCFIHLSFIINSQLIIEMYFSDIHSTSLYKSYLLFVFIQILQPPEHCTLRIRTKPIFDIWVFNNSWQQFLPWDFVEQKTLKGNGKVVLSVDERNPNPAFELCTSHNHFSFSLLKKKKIVRLGI